MKSETLCISKRAYKNNFPKHNFLFFGILASVYGFLINRFFQTEFLIRFQYIGLKTDLCIYFLSFSILLME